MLRSRVENHPLILGRACSAPNLMPIPNATDATEATVATEKVRDYLLNPEHPDGGCKAAWFQALGYAGDRWLEQTPRFSG